MLYQRGNPCQAGQINNRALKSGSLPLDRPAGAVAVIILILSMAAGIFTSCKNDLETIKSLDFTDTIPGMTARGVEIIYSENARVKIKLTSPYLVNQKKSDDPVLIFPDGFMVYFYDSLMNLKSTIKADYGISHEKKKLMEARHNVVVENMDTGETLNTEVLYWDREKALIYSDKFVKITKGNEVITGDGITSYEPFREIDILHPKGLIEVREETGNE